MFKKTLLSALAVSVIAASAQAASPVSAVNAGKGQLARAAGVSAAEFTTAELMRLIDAQRAGDTSEVAFILSHENRTEANPASAVTPGEAQLAAAAGVDPAKYTLDELVALQSWSDD